MHVNIALNNTCESEFSNSFESGQNLQYLRFKRTLLSIELIKGLKLSACALLHSAPITVSSKCTLTSESFCCPVEC